MKITLPKANSRIDPYTQENPNGSPRDDCTNWKKAGSPLRYILIGWEVATYTLNEDFASDAYQGGEFINTLLANHLFGYDREAYQDINRNGTIVSKISGRRQKFLECGSTKSESYEVWNLRPGIGAATQEEINRGTNFAKDLLDWLAERGIRGYSKGRRGCVVHR